MKNPRRRLLTFVLAGIGLLVVIAAVSGISLYADIQRIGCESAGQLLGPASAGGHIVSNANQPGACFVSFITVNQGDLAISRVVCTESADFAACQSYRTEIARGWSNFLGSRCTSIAFVGGASCGCIRDGAGCQQGSWPVEIVP